MTQVTIPTAAGNKDIDPALFAQYKDEAFGYLDTLEEAKGNLKEVIETLAESTGLTKGLVSKYLKARHAEKTADNIAEGKTFAALDEAV